MRHRGSRKSAGPFASRNRSASAISLAAACVLALAVYLCAFAQQPQQGGPTSKMGNSTGGVHAPVKDALSRPITAGGFVDGAPVMFVDATHAAGLEKFHCRSGGPEKRTIL